MPFPHGYKSVCVFVVTVLVAFLAHTAWAEVQIDSSRIWRRARVMNIGQKVWSFQTSYQKSDSRFDNSGMNQSAGQNYGRTVSWRELLNSEDAIGRADLRTYMAQRNLRESDTAAVSSYDLQREDLNLRLDWAFGLTRNWMIGFQAPLKMRTTRVRMKVDLMPELASGAGTLYQRSVLQKPLPSLQEKVRSMAAEEITRSGYDSVPEEKSSWEWGDITLLNQVGLLNRPSLTWSVQPMLRFPTARNASLEDYFEQTSDAGQIDLGLTSLTDLRLKRWVLGARLGYVVQLPDSVRKRLPTANDGESAIIDNNVDRDLGDYGLISVDAQYQLNRQFEFSFEHSYLVKEKDRFQGDSLKSTPYKDLADHTDQQLHQSRFEVLYNFGINGARSGITKEWKAALAYAVPWAGRNTVKSDQASLEVISYF